MNNLIEQFHYWLSCVVGAFLVLATMSPVMFAGPEEIRPVESTTAFELLKIESGVRQVPMGAEKLLRSVIDDATTMAARAQRQPRTRAEALAAFEAIQLAMVKHNFLQPPEEKDWPQTQGAALTPRTFTPEALNDVLSFPDNVRRKEYVDSTKPFFFVDCDMGCQFFMAVAERLGWDIRLVELPKHNFVRWHLTESIQINWDWVRWKSIDDKTYALLIPSSDDVRLRLLYLRSLEAREARAYLGLIGSEAALPGDGERLLQEAVTVLPNHPLTLNNFAWLYATKPEFAKRKSGVAVAYSLAAWSTQPTYGNFADTVACSLAANGQRELAEKVEDFAIAHPDSESQPESFSKNRKRISAGKPCQ